jgi:protein-disulfide isomerase
MASREEQKRLAREEREQRAASVAADDRRKRRLGMLGIAGAVAIAVVLAAVVISSSGGDNKGGGAQTGPAAGAADVQKRLDGIPQSGLTLGDPKAPVTLVEFADLQCPFCKEAATSAMPTLIDRYVRAGKLRIEFRNFAILGPDSEKAARALAGAAQQNKAWQFLELWYQNQGQEHTGYVTDQFIGRIAGGVPGLDAAQVVAASNDTQNTDSLGVARTEANKFGITSTPSFLIGRTGQPLKLLEVQSLDAQPFTQAIDLLLAQQ